MPDKPKGRMYSRYRTDSQGRTAPSAPSARVEPEEKASPLDRLPGVGKGYSEYKFLEECGTRFGISHLTLDRLFDRVELKTIEGIDRRFSNVQLLRVGACGAARAKQYEEAIAANGLMEVDDYSLETALMLKPVGTIEQFLDQFRHAAPIRDVLSMIQRDVPITAELLQQKPDVAELVVLFRELVDADVDLLLTVPRNKRTEAIQEITRLGLQCVHKLRHMVVAARAATRQRGRNIDLGDVPPPGTRPRITGGNLGRRLRGLPPRREK